MGPKFFAAWSAVGTAVNTLWGVFFMTHLMKQLGQGVLAWQDTLSAVVGLVVMLGLTRYLAGGKKALTDRVPVVVILWAGQLLGLPLVLLYAVVSIDSWQVVNIIAGGAFAPLMNTTMMEVRVKSLRSDEDRRSAALLTQTWSTIAQIGAGTVGGLLFMKQQPEFTVMLTLTGIGVIIPGMYFAAQWKGRRSNLLTPIKVE